MTKAQEVRKKRQEAIKLKEFEEEIEYLKIVKKIFEWILNQIDLDTQKGRLGVCSLHIFNNESNLYCDQECLDLRDILSKYDREKLFTTLEKTVNEEEGFSAVLNLNAYMYDDTGITFDISIT